MSASAAEIDAELRRIGGETFESLVATGLVDAGADPRLRELGMPRGMRETVARALADAEARGLGAHAEALRLTWLESMPRARLMQLCGRDPFTWEVFHGRAQWQAMPRLRRGLEALSALCAAHGMSCPGMEEGVAAFLAERQTLAELYIDTYYGRALPMFGAHACDMKAMEAEVGRGEEDLWAVVDRRLGHAIVHELLHFHAEREAMAPPLFDEAIAAWLGVRLDATVAYPDAGRDDALVGWPWFAQIGAALARTLGEGELLRAQAGVLAWEALTPGGELEVLGEEAWQAGRARPEVHFHPDTTRPDLWVRRIYELLPPVPDMEADAAMLADGLRAMCLEARQVEGAWRVRRAAPDGPVKVDFAQGVLRAPPRRSGWEPAPMIYALPPGLCTGEGALEVELDGTEAGIAGAAQRLMEA